MSHGPADTPVIDGFEFASAGARHQGVLPVARFDRLRDLLASDAGEVAYEVEGTRDEHGRPSLRVRVDGKLELRCQRCLEPMQVEVRTSELLVLAATQQEIDAEPAEGPDRVLAGKDMALTGLVEDELILALPYAPRHEACAPAGSGNAEKTDSPFAGLREMMRRDRH